MKRFRPSWVFDPANTKARLSDAELERMQERAKRQSVEEIDLVIIPQMEKALEKKD